MTRGMDNETVASRANELKKQHGDNVEVVARKKCGGTNFSLTCDCKSLFGDPKAPTIVCVNTKKKGTCEALEILEHEFVHVGQLANGRLIDAAAELEAYRKSCEIEAQHNCLKVKNCWTNQELAHWINQCAQQKVGGSLGSTNRRQIIRGCKNLCREWGLRNGLKNPLQTTNEDLIDQWRELLPPTPSPSSALNSIRDCLPCRIYASLT